MTMYFAGAGGSDSNDGTTWATRKLTANAAVALADTPGDSVAIGCNGGGIYRETVTVAASGDATNQITIFGDVSGEFTDGIGGKRPVITGSDDDVNGDRATVLSGGNNDYITLRDLQLELGTNTLCPAFGDNCVFDHVHLECCGAIGIIAGASAQVLRCSAFRSSLGAVVVGSDSIVERCRFLVCQQCIVCPSGTARTQVLNNIFIHPTAGCSFQSTGLTGADRFLFSNNVGFWATAGGGGLMAAGDADDASVIVDSNHDIGGDHFWVSTPTNRIQTARSWIDPDSWEFAPNPRGLRIDAGGTSSTEDDVHGVPTGLQNGGSNWGPVEPNFGKAFGSTGMLCTAPVLHRIQVLVADGVAFTCGVDVSWVGTITAKPQLILSPRYGMTATDTATGSGSSEPLSVGGTPSIPGGGGGIVDVLLYAPEVDTSVTFVGISRS
jgi:hypothetical protein